MRRVGIVLLLAVLAALPAAGCGRVGPLERPAAVDSSG